MSIYYDDNKSLGDTNKGYVMTSINSDNNYATCSAIDYEDRIVVGGFGWEDCSGGTNFLLCRYNPDGTLDETFGCDGGKISTDIQYDGNDDYAHALVIDSQNRIIVCGYTEACNDKIVVVRYKANGRLDYCFGDNGAFVTSIVHSNNAYAYGITLDSYDKILICGYTDTCSQNTNFAVIRLTNGGFLDDSFGDCGKINTDIRHFDTSGNDISGNSDYATGIIVDASDNIIVSGFTVNTPNTGVNDSPANYVMVRYTEGGQIDTSFGLEGTGMVVTDISNNSLNACTTIAIDSLDRIVLGGNSVNCGNNNFAIARYTSNGVIDTTFGVNGITITQISNLVVESEEGFIPKLTIDNSDRIVIVGAIESCNSEFIVIRYDASGNLDTDFGQCENGYVITDISDNDAFATNVEIDSHNKIVVTGYGFNCNKARFVVARYNDNGILDTEDRFYNKFSLDGGVTWKSINKFNKFKSQNYKNLLLIPGIDNEENQYDIILKSTNASVSNIFVLPNDSHQQNTNTESVSSILNNTALSPVRLGGVGLGGIF
jgi:uncharacterized delta-60 repeat protein